MNAIWRCTQHAKVYCIAAGVNETDHVEPIEDLVAHIAADAHVSSPCASIQQHIGCFVL